MTSRFIQFPNNSFRVTNELGYILADRAFSVIQARKIVSCTDCLCPVKQLTCLRIPCNLIEQRCANTTMPLFDAETRAPFKLGAGSLVSDLIVMKNPRACLDDCLQFMLGTICGNDCDSECDPQRWAGESCPISGAQLNQCGIVRVNIGQRQKNCPLYLCRTGQCAGQCGPAFTSSTTPCAQSTGAAGASSACTGCAGSGSESGDEGCGGGCDCDAPVDGCACTFMQDDGCCKYCGSCQDFAGGERADCLIGITLLQGSVGQDDLLISIETYGQCCTDGCDLDEETCLAPQFQFGGGYGGF